MALSKNPDPYKIDAGVLKPPGGSPASDSTPSFDPSFDVLENRGIHVVTLLRREMLDAYEIETLGADLQNCFKKKHQAKVVLDMHCVQHLSSAALGMLITLKATVEGTGGKLVLAGLRDELYQIFKLTKLHKVLTIKDDVSAAMASL